MTSASPVATTMASDNRESYPAQSFSLVQLLSATKSKLEDAMLGGRYAWSPTAQRAIYSYANLFRTTRALIRPEVRRREEWRSI